VGFFYIGSVICAGFLSFDYICIAVGEPVIKRGGLRLTYYIGNPGPGLVQAQKCGGVKPVNGNATLPS
jgi:hypothetical protein